jgi:hypothetical protein
VLVAHTGLIVPFHIVANSGDVKKLVIVTKRDVKTAVIFYFKIADLIFVQFPVWVFVAPLSIPFFCPPRIPHVK